MTASQDSDQWRKTSYSSEQTNCVEIALGSETARVRDTKAREVGHLEVSPQAWQSLADRL